MIGDGEYFEEFVNLNRSGIFILASIVSGHLSGILIFYKPGRTCEK